MQNETPSVPQDTIDLRELWAILVRRKKLIGGITAVVTLMAIIYVFTVKPIYSGSVTVEIGKVVNKEKAADGSLVLGVYDLDNVNDLAKIVSQTTNVSTSVPKRTKLLQLTATHTDKEQIEKNLKDAVRFIKERHQKIAKVYSLPGSEVIMSHEIAPVAVGDTPIKPKKKLIVIVAFISGLMLSIFLAFFLEFINGMRKED